MQSNTNKRILEIAASLFIKQGYTSTSMRQISEEVGIGKATIYHHFNDKQEIIFEIFRQKVCEMQEIIYKVENVNDLHVQLRVAVERSIEFINESSDIIRIIRREVPECWNKLESEVMLFFKAYLAVISKIIEAGIDKGVFRKVNPVEAAQVLLALLQGTFSLNYITGNRIESIGKHIDVLLDIYLKGIEAR